MQIENQVCDNVQDRLRGGREKKIAVLAVANENNSASATAEFKMVRRE